MSEQFCKAILNVNGKIEYVAPMLGSTDINDIVEDDKRYGKMNPINGEYFTYRISNVHDDEITDKKLQKAYTMGWRRWTKRIDFVIKLAKATEDPDFRVIFRTPETDERGVMDANTIMYHYFPINNVSNPLRGLCVVNSNFYYTVDGKMVSMYQIDPEHYDEDTTAHGTTIDIDQVFGHEDGHGIGLPHDSMMGQVMSPSYSFMAEFLTERDVFRGVKKYGNAKIPISHLTRWWRYIRGKSDRY